MFGGWWLLKLPPGQGCAIWQVGTPLVPHEAKILGESACRLRVNTYSERTRYGEILGRMRLNFLSLTQPKKHTMNRRNIFTLSAITALGLALLPGAAVAQQKTLKEQLTGTWIVVSIDQTASDGKKEQLYGPNPKGIAVYDASGQYVQIFVHPNVPKFKVNNRLQGTPEENTAAVRGTTASFGIWTVDEASKTISVRNVGGMFPNSAGTDSKRIVASVTADELKLSNPVTASGMRSDQVFRRAK